MSCGPAASITADTLAAYDYAAFTGQSAADDGPPPPLRLLLAEQRTTAADLVATLQRHGSQSPPTGTLILDVRPPEQFAIGHLAGAALASGAPGCRAHRV